MTDVEVRLRRIYDPPEPADGQRILVDGLWPRGLSKQDAQLDRWLKSVAPSRALRRWYGHDPDRFDEFRQRYHGELEDEERRRHLDELVAAARAGPVTVLTATRDVEHSHAAVLVDLLRSDRE